jgi:hypothetical protein
MKIMQFTNVAQYDLAIVGLGYESRAITVCSDLCKSETKIIALGYDQNTEDFSYQENLKFYKSLEAEILEGSDEYIYKCIFDNVNINWTDEPIHCLLDITVMSRSRLATIIVFLIENLHKNSTVTICYELAEYTEPSGDLSPIRYVGPIADSLSGTIGDINLPSSIVIGLGYEIGKGIGISNNLDTEKTFLFIPRGKDTRFENKVISNNKLLIDDTPKNHIFYYDISNPFKTYVDLRETMLAIMDITRPVIVPLGPKIFSALCVIFSKEMDCEVPVWRVSSEHHETPVDRKSSGNRFYLSLTI